MKYVLILPSIFRNCNTFLNFLCKFYNCFLWIRFLIYICSRNKYIFKYSSEKRKKQRFIPTKINLKISNHKSKGASSYSFYIFILAQIFIYVKRFWFLFYVKFVSSYAPNVVMLQCGLNSRFILTCFDGTCEWIMAW